MAWNIFITKQGFLSGAGDPAWALLHLRGFRVFCVTLFPRFAPTNRHSEWESEISQQPGVKQGKPGVAFVFSCLKYFSAKMWTENDSKQAVRYKTPLNYFFPCWKDRKPPCAGLFPLVSAGLEEGWGWDMLVTSLAWHISVLLSISALCHFTPCRTTLLYLISSHLVFPRTGLLVSYLQLVYKVSARTLACRMHPVQSKSLVLNSYNEKWGRTWNPGSWCIVTRWSHSTIYICNQSVFVIHATEGQHTV